MAVAVTVTAKYENGLPLAASTSIGIPCVSVRNVRAITGGIYGDSTINSKVTVYDPDAVKNLEYLCTETASAIVTAMNA